MAQETIFYSPIRAPTMVNLLLLLLLHAQMRICLEREREVGEDDGEEEEERERIMSMCHLYIFSFHHWAVHDRSINTSIEYPPSKTNESSRFHKETLEKSITEI
jgi:hypothetical protein